MKTAKQKDWKTEPFPSKHITVTLDLHFTQKEMQKIKRGFVPEQMEEKWFVFHEQDILYFHRSWTGFCIYKVYFRIEGKNHVATHADVNRDVEQYKQTDNTHDQQLIPYLINVLLLHKPCNFINTTIQPEQNAVYEWGIEGRAMLGDNPENKPDIRNEEDMDFVRIIPAQRFTGLPAPAHRPYSFYADSESLDGLTLAECYSLVNGLSLPPKEGYWQKENRTPYAWTLDQGDIDAPLAKISIFRKGNINFEAYPRKWIEDSRYVVLRVRRSVALRELDAFPATWRALSYIISDPGRMGARLPSWDMEITEYASARIHALFCEVKERSGGELLALKRSKESLGLTDLNRLPEPAEELEYYHYLSEDSLLTNKIVELFGISHRCWHGCGYLGWPGSPLCRFFLLRNQIISGIRVSIMGGRKRFVSKI